MLRRRSGFVISGIAPMAYWKERRRGRKRTDTDTIIKRKRRRSEELNKKENGQTSKMMNDGDDG